MKIALVTLGTRGDVQPYAVLGREFKMRGHQVVLSTAKNFESLVKSYGIDFVPVEADFQALLESDHGKEMMKNPLLAQRNFKKWVYPMIYDALQTFYNLARENDKVLFHGKTLAGYFADQFPEKMIRANVVPAFEATSEFVNPVLSGWHLPSFLNKFTYRLTEFSYRMMHKPIRQFREANGLSLEIKDFGELLSIYGISKYLLPEPTDYPTTSHFAGFWYGNSPSELDEATKLFLQDGTPPLLITFGSMPLPTKLDLQKLIINIVKRFDLRVVIIKGWGFEQVSELAKYKQIKIIESAPYEKLLPFVRAVVHHGGLGTTAECLRAGKPFLTCPVMYPTGDQNFWGQLSYEKGCALRPIALKKLDEDQFVSAIGELLTNKFYSDNAYQMAELLKLENGLDNAIRLVEDTSES